MATFYSNEYAGKYRTLPINVNIHRNLGNTLRYAVFHYTQVATGTIDDFLYLVKVPGDARIIVPACFFSFSAWDTNTLLDVGWAAYENKQGVLQVADFDGLIDGLDIDAAGVYTGALTQAPALYDKEFSSRHEVDIVAQFRVAAPTATDTLIGHIAYLI